MAKRIYYRSMGEMMGPVTGDQLREQAVKGIVTPETLVRVGDDGEWVRATRLTDLFDAEGHAIGPKHKASTKSRGDTHHTQATWTTQGLVIAVVAALVLLSLLVGILVIVF